MHPLAELFEKNEIKEIAIIDDSFDFPTREDDDDNKTDKFWEAIKDSKESLNELKSLSIEIISADEITNDVLKKIYQNAEALNHLKDAFQKFLNPLSNDKKEDNLQALCDYLKSDISINYKCFGAEIDLQEPIYKIIFIDYYLGPAGSVALKNAALDHSKRIAKQIWQMYDDKSYKPIFILMSSHPISDAMRDDFRNSTDIMGGMFNFIAKDDMRDKEKLLLELYPIARSIESSNQICSFINSLNKGIENSTNNLLKQVKGLSISDYAYIQKLSLQDEGHPFGDYLLWLFGKHFVGQLLSKLSEDKVIINALSFDDLPSSQFIPSLYLTEIYQNALFESISNESQPYLGDVFIKDNKVRMIINAECDLVREIETDFSMLLLHGELIKHTEKDPKASDSSVRTEFIEIDKEENKESFRIAWYLSRVESLRYSDINKLVDERGYKKVCRLKSPFVLQIKNAFSSNLSRIGVPVPLPIHSPLNIEVFCEGDESKATIFLKLTENAGRLFYTKKKDKCIFVNEFIYTLLRNLNKPIEILDKLIENCKKDGNTKKENELGVKKAILEKLYDRNCKDRLKLLDAIDVPNVSGSKEFNSIYFSRGIDNIEGKVYPSEKCPLWINLIDP